jgi:putative restriction endonuclease
MDRKEVLHLFERLKMWAHGDQRAPHKPLLVLYAIGCWQRGQTDLLYADVYEDLANLLREFGPRRKVDRPEHPFWRLQNDKVWEVTSSAPIPIPAEGTPSRKALLDGNACGRFLKDIQVAFRRDATLPKEIARMLLTAHFPETVHDEIATAAGVSLSEDRAIGGGRDPGFRKAVLTSYEYRCALCRFQLLLSGAPVGLEAAHIKWHQAAGPSIQQNGLCFCVLHHKLFDLGAFTVGEDLVVLVSDEASGPESSPDLLLTYHGKTVSPPIHKANWPAKEYLGWHSKEVFRGKTRPV